MYVQSLANIADLWSRGFDKNDGLLNRRAVEMTVNLVSAAHDKFGIQRWDDFTERFVYLALRFMADNSDNDRYQIVTAIMEGRAMGNYVHHATMLSDAYVMSMGEISDEYLSAWLNLDKARFNIVDSLNTRFVKPASTRVALIDGYKEEAAGVFLVAVEHIANYMATIRDQARKGA